MIGQFGNRKDIAMLLSQAYNKIELLEHPSVSPVPAYVEVYYEVARIKTLDDYLASNSILGLLGRTIRR